VATRAYTRTRGRASTGTVERVLRVAERFIKEGKFHAATIDELAVAAGVSRATVFNRFGSKLGILEALADRAYASPEMVALQEALKLDDAVEALEAMIAAACAIWEAQGFVHEQLNAIVVLEPAAAGLVEEQEVQQRAEIEGVVRRLARDGRLRAGLGEARAVATLHMLTSLESFLRLRRDHGLSLRQTRDTVTELGRTLLRA
jgi:AcrR family transcriptional regulator